MTQTPVELLVATHAALLHVALDVDAGKAEVAVLHDACPVYFGIAPVAGGMLFAARNVGPDFQVVSPGLPTGAIWHLPHGSRTPEPYIVHQGFVDLHQIHALGNWLLVVLGIGSRLAVFDIATRRLAGTFELAAAVPPDLRRTDRPLDQYHFNSISSAGDRLYVLAHNWTEGSFALEFQFHSAPGQPPSLSLLSIHRGLGQASHDIVFDGGTLFVLDGEGGALIARGHPAGRTSLPNQEAKPYPRGLVVMPDNLIVGYGSWSAERSDRGASPTKLCVFDRHSLAMRLALDLGPFGNPSAISLLRPPPSGDQLK